MFAQFYNSFKYFCRNWKISKEDLPLWASPVNEGIFEPETSHYEMHKTLSQQLLLAKILETDKLVDLKIQLTVDEKLLCH